eukprot:6206619-Pleurochrysis_carterae.AAC.1
MFRQSLDLYRLSDSVHSCEDETRSARTVPVQRGIWQGSRQIGGGAMTCSPARCESWIFFQS